MSHRLTIDSVICTTPDRGCLSRCHGWAIIPTEHCMNKEWNMPTLELSLSETTYATLRQAAERRSQPIEDVEQRRSILEIT